MRNHETSSLNSSSSCTTLLLVYFFMVFFQVIFLQNFRNAFIVLKNIFKQFSTRSLISLLITNQDNVELQRYATRNAIGRPSQSKELKVHFKLDLESNSILHISLQNEVNCSNES